MNVLLAQDMVYETNKTNIDYIKSKVSPHSSKGGQGTLEPPPAEELLTSDGYEGRGS